MTLQEFAESNALNSSMSAGAFFSTLASKGITAVDYTDSDISEFLGLARSSGTVGMAKSKHNVTTKSARGNGKRVASTTTIASFSEEFKLALTKLVSNGFISKDCCILACSDGSKHEVSRDTAKQLQKLLDATPHNADAMYYLRHVSDNDYTLAGVESHAMRERRIAAATAAAAKLDAALALVAASGYKVVRPDSSILLAQFLASENTLLCDQSTVACQSVRNGLSKAWRNEKRLERIAAARVLREVAKQQTSINVQVSAVTEEIIAHADAKLTQAMAQANLALIEKQAALDAAAAREAQREEQMAAMQAQIAALMAAMQGGQAKPE